MLRAIPILLFAGATAFVSTSSLRDARITTAAKTNVVTIHAKDFAYTAPKTITAGQTTFRLINDGKEAHHITLIKLAPGKTLADLEKALKGPPGPPPAWITLYGGPNAAIPGATIEATIDMDAGNYVLACFIPSPGETMPHMMKGMVAQLTVVPAGGVAQAGAAASATGPTPVPDMHLELKDYGFVLSKPITAGKHTIHIMNNGPQDHEAVFVRLAPGKHVSDFSTWIETGMKGPPPAMMIQGMATMGKGRTAIFSENFTPGNYGITCFVGAPDGKIHAAHGMNYEFAVK